MLRLSDLATTTNGSDTPAANETTRSEHTPFNDACALHKYEVDSPFSPTELVPQVASTPLDESVACKPLGGTACAHNTLFLEHLDSSMPLSISMSASYSRADARDGQERDYGNDLEYDRKDNHAHTATDSCTDTIPVGESKDSLFTTSASSLSAIETPAPATPPTPTSPVPDLCAASPTSTSTSPGAGKLSIARSMLPVLAKHLRRLSFSGSPPDRERLVDKLRGLRSLSRSRSGPRSRSSSGARHGSGSPPASVWQGSPARSDSSRSENITPSPSPVKGSGIPVLQRRMTVRARRNSVRRV